LAVGDEQLAVLGRVVDALGSVGIDYQNLLQSASELDWDYLTHWAPLLGVSTLLDEVKS
jgi:hypothetical protein